MKRRVLNFNFISKRNIQYGSGLFNLIFIDVNYAYRCELLAFHDGEPGLVVLVGQRLVDAHQGRRRGLVAQRQVEHEAFVERRLLAVEHNVYLGLMLFITLLMVDLSSNQKSSYLPACSKSG